MSNWMQHIMKKINFSKIIEKAVPSGNFVNNCIIGTTEIDAYALPIAKHLKVTC